MPNLSTRFQQAMSYAAELHAEQRRKGTDIPYVAHLLSVTSLVLEHGGDEDQAIAALLHDAIEDQPRDGETRLFIREHFGPGVLEIVEACTDDVAGLDRGKDSWRARKEAYLQHLAHAPASTLLVSIADKLHNARSILADVRVLGEELWPRFNCGKDGSLWYYRALVQAFAQLSGSDGFTRLVGELERTVKEIEQLAG